MTEIFMKIEGVTGTAIGAHQGWLKVSSAMLSVTRKKAVVVSREQDQASYTLFKMSMDGTEIPKLTIDFVKDGRIATRIELTNVLIGEFHLVPGQPPVESMSFNHDDLKAVMGVTPVDNAAMAGALVGTGARTVRR